MDYIKDYTEQHSECEAQQGSGSVDRPVCSCCKDRIKAKHYYNIDGEIFCKGCLDDNFCMETDNFLF